MWSDRTKIALGEKIFRKKKFADTFLLFIQLATVQIQFEGERIQGKKIIRENRA